MKLSVGLVTLANLAVAWGAQLRARGRDEDVPDPANCTATFSKTWVETMREHLTCGMYRFLCGLGRALPARMRHQQLESPLLVYRRMLNAAHAVQSSSRRWRFGYPVPRGLRQNDIRLWNRSVFSFIAARRRRGSEPLARQCIEMGVNLEEIDLHGQTPLFWAAKRGNMMMVKFLLNLGFAKKSAVFLALSR